MWKGRGASRVFGAASESEPVPILPPEKEGRNNRHDVSSLSPLRQITMTRAERNFAYLASCTPSCRFLRLWQVVLLYDITAPPPLPRRPSLCFFLLAALSAFPLGGAHGGGSAARVGRARTEPTEGLLRDCGGGASGRAKMGGVGLWIQHVTALGRCFAKSPLFNFFFPFQTFA